METVQQAIILNTKGELLLLKCGKSFGKDLAGKWEFPNGFLDEDEKPEEDLKNEVKELTGLEIDIIYQFFSSIMKEGEAELLNVAYLCRLKGPAKIKLHEDYEEAKWIKANEIKKLKVTNSQVLEMAEKAIAVLGGGGAEE
jgi:ADP-ribose pyrophosphatase YjhB (NUDIX family)